ncbi:hypothetical protein FA15DRAFT_757079 [Coprinopsis marcescibilis]|uniref:Uncharacterized protein n=1 Tax=Coprinopsis marcescibilis TaxID=230819 RepID=A0A5C3L652_COPMA|nr:hypothetical protein FA15DRAFT_757079 [Coprinopsis marcescibilis]
MSVRNATLCSPRPSAATLGETMIVETTLDLAAIPINHVAIKVDRFGFSANNITYQALGEHPHFRYFDFHTAPTSELAKTHGLIPVWGFGTVVASKHPKITIGERVYGYFAPTRYLVVPVSPSDVNKHAFYVPRPNLPPNRRPYNQIQRCATDPTYSAVTDAENLTMLYRPLFWTSYWCEDWLYSTGCYTPSDNSKVSILISSASSKTAFCLAYLIQKRIGNGELKNTKVVGLTSTRNAKFTENLGLYDEVHEYDTFRSDGAFQMQSERQWIYIDVAGNGLLNKEIQRHFASSSNGRVVKNVSLGVTNLQPTSSANDSMKWSHNAFDPTAPALAPSDARWPKTENFFMPEWLSVRKHQLPVSEIFQRQLNAWGSLMKDCINWVELQPVLGAKQVHDAYTRLAKEGLGPDKGLIWSLWEEGVAASINGKL